MKRKVIAGLAASSALLLAASALAHPGGGGGGGMGGGGMGGGMGGGGMGGGGFGGHSDMGMGSSSVRDEGFGSPTFRDNSQGPSHVSTTGGEHADRHSVVFGAGAPTGPLAGLRPGMTVIDANGRVIGTVSKVIRSSGGVTRNVLVTPASSTGLHRHTLPVRPNDITLSGTTAHTSFALRPRKG